MPTSLAPLLWFALVIALIPAALWLLKRTPVGAIGAQRGLRSVATLALAPNQRVVTVEVGSGDARRWLVLGVTPHNVTLLLDMPPQAEPPAAPAAGGSPFAQLLGRARSGATPHAGA